MGDHYNGKVVLITNAGNPIGFACAKVFANEGSKIIVTESSPEPGLRIVKSIRQAGRVAEFIQTDVSDSSQVDEAVAFAVSQFGRLDVMVNNASVDTILDSGDIKGWTNDGIWKPMHSSYGGCCYGTRAAVNQFLQQRTSGWIINIASILERPGFSALAPYFAARQAIIAMTESAAEEFGLLGIRINAVTGVATTEEIAEQVLLFASEHIPSVWLRWPQWL